MARVRDRGRLHRVGGAGAGPAPRRARACAGGAGRRGGVQLQRCATQDWSTALPHDPGRRAGDGAGAPARRLGGAERDAGGAGARRRGADRLVPEHLADRRRAAMPRPTWATCSSGRRAPGASARCCRCRCSTAAAARPACRAPTRQLDGALAELPRARCWSRSRTWKTSSSALRLLARAGRACRRARSTSAQPRHGAVGLALPQRLVSQLDLLDARRSELRNRRQALQVRSAQYQATVGLIRALGGGWDVPQTVRRGDAARRRRRSRRAESGQPASGRAPAAHRPAGAARQPPAPVRSSSSPAARRPTSSGGSASLRPRRRQSLRSAPRRILLSRSSTVSAMSRIAGIKSTPSFVDERRLRSKTRVARGCTRTQRAEA